MKITRRMPKLVSLLLPTRGRIKQLLELLSVLEARTVNHRNVEILLKFDNDDHRTIRGFRDVPTKFEYTIVISPRLDGYRSLHVFYNQLASLSQGDWLFIFNDDMTITQYGWDLVLDDIDPAKCRSAKWVDNDEICVISPFKRKRRNLFPIVSRRYYEVLGHLSLNAQNDDWIEWVALSTGVEVNCPQIGARHLRHEFSDSTKEEGLIGQRENIKKLWAKGSQRPEMQEDVEKLRTYLRTKLGKEEI